MARSVALSFAVLLAVFEIGSCLMCYECHTGTDASCGDFFQIGHQNFVDCNSQKSVTRYLSEILDPRLLESTAGETKYCAKVQLKNGIIARGCLSQTTCSQIKVKYCLICYSHLCNGAGSATFSLPLATLALVASHLYYKQ